LKKKSLDKGRIGLSSAGNKRKRRKADGAAPTPKNKSVRPSKGQSSGETRLIQKMRSRKVNLLKVHAAMGKLCLDAVDKEVHKRFKVIIDTMEYDITKKVMNQILKDPRSVSLSEFDENLQPYIKHYLFLMKRNKRQP